MGDRTALQVIVHDAHPDEVSAIFEALEQYTQVTTIELGDVMLIEEASCGSSDELASALASEAPQSCFTIWEDPKYDWLGSLNMIHRDLGTFTAECDSNGFAQFTEETVHKIVADQPGEHTLNLATGRTWRLAFADIDKSNEGKSITYNPEED